MSIPKIIHLCWFSDDPYPVEIKSCLRSWQRVIPDYEIRIWDYDAAKAIGNRFIDEALVAGKWAFAADVVRFYAVWKEGGVYMDSDIYLYRRFDNYLSRRGCTTFCECVAPGSKKFGLQAAFFAGEPGNGFCKEMFDHYANRSFLLPDGTFDQTISPHVMAEIALRRGFVYKDIRQELDGLSVWPTAYLSPSKSYKRRPEAIGMHCIYGSWRKRKFGRRIELGLKHVYNVLKYYLLGR